MPCVVLLGDSIFDNAAYTRGGPHVARQVNEALPDGWRGVLAAVDGAVVGEVPAQLRSLPRDATHLVLSAGGNDALGHTGLLDRPARLVAEVLGWLAERGYGDVQQVVSAEERLTFALPHELRRDLRQSIAT